jgi:hypothetical protein
MQETGCFIIFYGWFSPDERVLRHFVSAGSVWETPVVMYAWLD